MNSIGIRINDSKPLSDGEILNFSMIDILKLIKDGKRFKWAILKLEATGNFTTDMTIPQLEKEIQNSQNGILYAKTTASFLTGVQIRCIAIWAEIL